MMKLNRWHWMGGATLVVLGAIGAGLHIYTLYQPIPKSVLKQAGFGVWYPAKGSLGMEIERDSVKYSASGSDRLVSLVTRNERLVVAFTEQALPESFIDIPEVYDAMIKKMRGYSNFESVNGSVALTRPEELKGGQTAVMKARGTLVFMRPEQDLSLEQWRELVNNLRFVH